MNPSQFSPVLLAAVIVAAAAIVCQALFLYGMFRSVKALKDQVSVFIPRAEATLQRADRAIADSTAQWHDLSSRAVNVIEAAHKQLTRVDDVLGEATVRAKAQMERVEMVLDDTIGRVHNTVILLNNGVLKPVKEINGVAAGVRAALQQLIGSRRPSVAQATADEEMFI